MKEREAAGSVLMDTIVDEGSPNQNPCHVQEVFCPVTKVSCNLVCGALNLNLRSRHVHALVHRHRQI